MTIELVRSTIDLVIAPFPGTSLTFNASVEWRPTLRSDVKNQNGSLQDTIQAGHPLAAEASRIQSEAETFLTDRFGARGEDLVSSPVSSLTITFDFDHPADFASNGVMLRVVGIWKPTQYLAETRPQVEVIEQMLPGGNALVPDFQAVADYVLTLATAEYPGQTVVEPTP